MARGGHRFGAHALAIALLGAAVVGALYFLPVESWMEALKEWTVGLGPWGLPAFVGAYVAAVLLLVPGAPLTLAAGALFGVALGVPVVSAASTTAAIFAFGVARAMGRERIERWTRASPRLEAIDSAVGEGGWKVVVLLRLSPVVPFSASNYLFGLTKLAFLPYLAGSFVGMLPGTLLYVYLGHLGAQASSGGAKSPLEWIFLAAGFAASVVAVVWMSRAARSALEERGALHGTS